MTSRTEDRPATVPPAQQAGETPAAWRWVQPCAWTIRMLTALIQGVKGQKWFRLFDKVFAERNLWASFQRVLRKKGAAGVDHVTVDEFERRLPDSVWELSDQLKARTYRPQAVRRRPPKRRCPDSQARYDRDTSVGPLLFFGADGS